MTERNQLFKSMNKLTDIMYAKKEGDFRGMVNALLDFNLEDYTNIAKFVDEMFEIDRDGKRWKDFVEEVDKMPKCIECGVPVGKDNIGKDLEEGLFTCKECEED